MEAIQSIEIAANLFLQSLGVWLAGPMRFFSFLGQEEFFMLVMPAIFWCLDARTGLRMGAMLLLSGVTNGYLKQVFHSPRPYWVNPQVQSYAFESSFGFPSGHAQNAAALWGTLAASLRRRWVTSLVIAAVFMIGLSRLALGVHFASDVLAGWVLGLGLLWAFLKLERPLLRWFAPLPLSLQLLLAFASALALILINAAIVYLLGGWSLPQAWVDQVARVSPDHPIAPLSLSGAVTNAGTWFGLAAGAAWLWKRGGYSARGEGWKLAARYGLGLVGVGVLWFGLGRVFPRSEDWIGYGLRFTRYALVGLWTTGLAPYLFMRLGLGGEPAPEKIAPEGVNPL